MAQPRLAPHPSDDVLGLAIDRYVDTVSQRFVTTLLATIASFEEPTTVRPDRAMRLVGYLVETLVGHAIGAALGPIHSCLKRHAGDDHERDAIRRELGEVIGQMAVAPGPTGPMIVRRVIADAARRPLVDELGARMHLKLAHGTRALRVAVRRIAARIANPALLVAAIDGLGADDASALRFGDQLAIGWRVYLAALAGRGMPEHDHAASRELWQGWLRRVRNEREVRREIPKRVGARAVHGATVLSDYIMSVG